MSFTPEIDELSRTVDQAYACADTLQVAYEERLAEYEERDLVCLRWQDESSRPDGTATGTLIYSQAHAALEVAREMQSFNRELTQRSGPHPIASWLTLRPVLEASLRAHWVLAPTEYRIDEKSMDGKAGDGRVERAARWARSSLREGQKFARLLQDGTMDADFDQRIAALEKEIKDRDLTVVKGMVDTVSIAEKLPEPTLAKAAVAYWRLISGLDHGDETAQDTAWVPVGEHRVRSDNCVFLGACLSVTRVRCLALRRFLELMREPGE